MGQQYFVVINYKLSPIKKDYKIIKFGHDVLTLLSKIPTAEKAQNRHYLNSDRMII